MRNFRLDASGKLEEVEIDGRMVKPMIYDNGCEIILVYSIRIKDGRYSTIAKAMPRKFFYGKLIQSRLEQYITLFPSS